MRATDWPLSDWQGQPPDVSRLAGLLPVVLFGAYWCTDFQAALPAIRDFARTKAGQIQLLYVGSDFLDEADYSDPQHREHYSALRHSLPEALFVRPLGIEECAFKQKYRVWASRERAIYEDAAGGPRESGLPTLLVPRGEEDAACFRFSQFAANTSGDDLVEAFDRAVRERGCLEHPHQLVAKI